MASHLFECAENRPPQELYFESILGQRLRAFAGPRGGTTPRVFPRWLADQRLLDIAQPPWHRAHAASSNTSGPDDAALSVECDRR
jgi:hypothetical protein